MDQRVILKITLPPEEIIATKLLVCKVNGCQEQFSNASHLQMHLTRHHRLQPSERQSGVENESHIKHFHCPIESCLYNLNASGEKFFSSFRNLKQHFLKVHSARNFICFNCNGQKSFATESLLRAHQTNCGQSFICKICGYSYGSREALLTHAKRKNHGYEELMLGKKGKRKVAEIMSNTPLKTFKKTNQSSIQLQTDLIGEKSEEELEFLQKSQTTQTDLITSNLTAKIECSTQTSTNPNMASSIESVNASTTDNYCQTNLEQLSYFDDSSLTCFGNGTVASNNSSESVTCVCTETQTDLIYDEMFPNEDRTDPMLYSHMYTQTCVDIFSDLALSTIETQTNWEDGLGDYLVSTETQTNLMSTGSNDHCGAQGKISSIQTQTSASMEFLNAISSESSSTHTQTS